MLVLLLIEGAFNISPFWVSQEHRYMGYPHGKLVFCLFDLLHILFNFLALNLGF